MHKRPTPEPNRLIDPRVAAACVTALLAIGLDAAVSASPHPAAAGAATRVVTAGRIVALGSDSAAPQADASLRVEWTLAARPAGSAARLVDAGGAAPLLHTDLPGTYVVDQ